MKNVCDTCRGICVPRGKRDSQFCHDATSQISQDPLSEGIAMIHLQFPRWVGDVTSFRFPHPVMKVSGLLRTSPGPLPPLFIPGANLSFTDKHPVNNELGGVL